MGSGGEGGKGALAVLFACVTATALAADNLPVGQSMQRLPLQTAERDHVNYLLYIPAEYYLRSSSVWPLILFLHGSRQRGDDPALLRDGALLSFTGTGNGFPFIIIAPQCPRNTVWSPRVLKRMLDEIEGVLRIDSRRIYLTGFSMGGYGTWETAIAYPELFAAIAPLCGGGDVANAYRLKGVPVWAFHGAKDKNVPLAESTKMIEAIRRAGGDAKLTVYPDLEHDCWTITYRDSRLYRWFLDHRLSP
jgi:predicted peptidase